MISAIFVFILSLAGSVNSETKIQPACSEMAGSDELLAKANTKYVMLGEIHGNNEMPMMAADIACLYAESGKPVTVALEWDNNNQTAIDTYLASDGGEEALAAFGTAPVWQGFQDGRASGAILHLIERLRVMHLAGKIRRVIAIDQIGQGPNWNREKAMADNILAIDRGEGGVIVTLIGNYHSRKAVAEDGDDADGRKIYTAGYLPADETVSLMMLHNGGQSWVCYSDHSCGPKEMGRERNEARAIKFIDNPYKHDGILELGVPITASSPAKFD
jgi:hypothetical protein